VYDRDKIKLKVLRGEMKTAIKVVNVLSITLAVVGILILILVNIKLSTFRLIEDSKIKNSSSTSKLNVVLAVSTYEKGQKILAEKSEGFSVCNVKDVVESDGKVQLIMCDDGTALIEKNVVGQLNNSIPVLGYIVDIYKKYLTWIILVLVPVVIFTITKIKSLMPTLFVKNVQLSESDTTDLGIQNHNNIFGKLLEKEETFIDSFEPKINAATEKIEEQTAKVKDKINI
jgi:hypothetical protein